MSKPENWIQKLVRERKYTVYATIAAIAAIIVPAVAFLADIVDITTGVPWPKTQVQQYIETLKDDKSVEPDRADAAEALGKLGVEKLGADSHELCLSGADPVPNNRLQATANSVRSCLAPAVCRA